MDEPAGPTIEVEVVGVLRSLEDITDFPEAFLMATPAFVEEHGDQVFTMRGNIMVNADPSRLDSVQAGLQAAAGDHFIAGPLDENYAGRIDETVDVEVTALWVFAAVAAFAGLLIVHQAMTRHASQLANERAIRETLGFTRRDHVTGSVLVSAPAVLLGVVGSLALAAMLSPLFPRGLARRAEATPGFMIDRPVLGLGAVAVLALGGAMVVVTAWRDHRRVNNRGGGGGEGAIGRLAAALPVTAGLGLRFALGPGGRRGGIGWAGLVGVAMGVAGLLAVAAVDSSADHLMSTPRLFGANVDAVLGLEPGEDPGPIVERVAADPDVVAIGLLDRLESDPVAQGPGGRESVDPEALRSVVGTIPGTITEGRLPQGPDEVVIGDVVAERLGAGVGDALEVQGHDGPVDMVVVGRIISAGVDELGGGFFLTMDGLEALQAGCSAESEDISCRTVSRGMGVAFRPGADVDAAISRLAEIDGRFEAFPLPSVVNNLEQIGSTPWLLAAFLAVMGLGGLAHALVVGSGRRERYLAIVRALGLRPGQAGGAIHWQAAALAAVGAAVGLVLGAVAGRLIWRRVAEGIGAVVEIVVPLPAVAAAVAVALAAAVVVAVVPALRAARMRPAEILRTE
jgi:putative ABC transport system permease protein